MLPGNISGPVQLRLYGTKHCLCNALRFFAHLMLLYRALVQLLGDVSFTMKVTGMVHTPGDHGSNCVPARIGHALLMGFIVENSSLVLQFDID